MPGEISISIDKYSLYNGIGSFRQARNKPISTMTTIGFQIPIADVNSPPSAMETTP
jgi:hypothetical protein